MASTRSSDWTFASRPHVSAFEFLCLSSLSLRKSASPRFSQRQPRELHSVKTVNHRAYQGLPTVSRGMQPIVRMRVQDLELKSKFCTLKLHSKMSLLRKVLLRIHSACNVNYRFPVKFFSNGKFWNTTQVRKYLRTCSDQESRDIAFIQTIVLFGCYCLPLLHVEISTRNCWSRLLESKFLFCIDSANFAKLVESVEESIKESQNEQQPWRCRQSFITVFPVLKELETAFVQKAFLIHKFPSEFQLI